MRMYPGLAVETLAHDFRVVAHRSGAVGQVVAGFQNGEFAPGVSRFVAAHQIVGRPVETPAEVGDAAHALDHIVRRGPRTDDTIGGRQGCGLDFKNGFGGVFACGQKHVVVALQKAVLV
jgi:hypothetical protein